MKWLIIILFLFASCSLPDSMTVSAWTSQDKYEETKGKSDGVGIEFTWELDGISD
ncbi:hypothetical protein LCGC14_0376390 [marine sediment metagenome]|uniref:Uncharacterized protein n=1 Tax=marine sediment metagenome TaxID=412755 RepID=A0A0F9VR39_9ZZZZ